ncbi:MAG: thioredoxin family protein [Chthoniobacterales bacterium]
MSGVKILRLVILVLALSFPGLSSARADANWLSDFRQAQEEAKASHKLLLIDFTGSDWCPWCLRMQAEVFSKPEFEQYAKDHLVLMTADFPRTKALSNEVRRQNQELAQRYQIDGFPTIVVLNSDGKQIGLLSYAPGGPGAFINQLKKLPKS